MADSEQLFDLVVLGHDSHKPVEILVKDILNLLDDNSPYLEFKLSDALLFNNGMVSIRDGITFEAAQEIRKKLATLAVDCDIRPTLQLIPKEMEETGVEAAIYTCPACGHKQAKRKQQNGRLESCEVCGIVGERYLQKQKLEQVMDAERHRHENDRAKRIREVLERAKQEEEALLQAEARRRLGLAEKPDNIGIKIAAVVAALSISFGTVYYLNQPTPEEIAQQEKQAAEQQQAKEEQQKEAMAKTMAAATERAGDMTDMLEKIPASGAAEPTGNPEEAIAETVSPMPPAAPPENKPEPKTEERQAQMTEALKADSQQPETPAEVTEAKVKEEASSSAIIAMEEEKLTPPRLQVFPDVHAENRRRIQQLLKLDESDLTDMIIDKAEEPYQRALLLLDIVEWQLQNNKPDKAQETIARIPQELDKTQDISQQALILGCISKTHLLQDAWEEAGNSLQQAMEKAETLPQLPEQISLLTRLANEQSLFGNQIAARQILETAGKLSESLPESVEPRSSALVQLASGYAMITDFAEANKLMDKVQDPAKRQKLAEFIDKLQHRVEQVRAEYQQAAVN
ncbi:MAG: hypothetical protein KJ914_13335 [Gammaproteobacteria bacterium]|nr:hypothetical protein [Gammaproteobacteria bacterium]MBU1725420.1 hypothetical protein [Gammaproteobacteria bacterium]MBU2005290.1 hypothetical protein [Gammaproteobacteria bacterium]